MVDVAETSPSSLRAAAIAGAWEALVWVVEDEEEASVLPRLRSLKESLGAEADGVMASYCRSLQQHLEIRGFEGLTPVLYDFHLRIQSMLDAHRATVGRADA